jgi:hypothetical protein
MASFVFMPHICIYKGFYESKNYTIFQPKPLRVFLLNNRENTESLLCELKMLFQAQYFLDSYKTCEYKDLPGKQSSFLGALYFTLQF